MKNTLIAILVIIILVLGFLFVKGKSKPVVDNSWPETVPATPTDNNSQTNSNNNTNPCAPSIVVSAPATGVSYTLGQQVTIKWTTCNVQKVLIGLASGGKNYGHITQNPISASTGSYQWTATNPGKSFTDLNTNSYQIVVESEDGSVMAKSGTFSVTTQQNNDSSNEVYSAHGISVFVPDNYYGRSSEIDYGAQQGYKYVSVLDGGGRPIVQIVKYPDQVRFNEDSPTTTYFTLEDSNYPIGGTVGQYYKGRAEYSGETIVVPSKLILVNINLYTGVEVPRQDINSIIDSIEFN